MELQLSYIRKEGAQSIAPILTRIFNYSLEIGSLPRDWTRANVIPIHNKGIRRNPNNYRPVSLTGHVTEVAECINGMKVRQFVSPLITPVQHGFRPKHSCLTQLVQTIHCLAQTLDKACLITSFFWISVMRLIQFLINDCSLNYNIYWNQR